MSNEEEITRLKQKCEAKIRELRQRHKLEIAVKDREIQNCNQEIAVKDSKIQDCREQIAYLRKLIMTVAERGVIYNNIEVNTTAESKSMTDSSSKNIKVGGDVTG